MDGASLENNDSHVFIGQPCPRGHVERYKSNGQCAVCLRASARNNYSKNREQYAKKRRREYVKRAEYYQTTVKKWRLENRERVLEYKRGWYYRHKAKILDRMRAHGHKKRGMPLPVRPRPENCELCGNPEPRGVLHLDHCHTTNKFRGWLCSRCNLGLGKLGDSVETIRAALAYLERAL